MTFARAARDGATDRPSRSRAGSTAPTHPPARLTIGSVDDAAEREADGIAEAAMRLPAGPSAPRASAAAPVVARAGPVSGDVHGGRAAPASVGAVLAGAGQPLPDGVRGEMEQRLGQDFGGVRIHTDAAAGESARDVAARAYTVGSHIAFASGAFRDDGAGRRLLAHELAHVIQQGGAADHDLAGAAQAGAQAWPVHRLARRIQRQADGPILRRDPDPAPPAAGAQDWLKAFPRAARGPGGALPAIGFTQAAKGAKSAAPTLTNQAAGMHALTPEQATLRQAIVAARASTPRRVVTLGQDEKGNWGWTNNGKSRRQPSQIQKDAEAGAGAARDAQVRQAIWKELEKEGGTSSINAYDSQRLTWGRGLGIKGGALAEAMPRMFADAAVASAFTQAGIGWSGGGFLVFNEANNLIESGDDALSLIQARADLLDVFVDVGEREETNLPVADEQWKQVDKRIQQFPKEMRDGWDLNAFRLAFHLTWWGSSPPPADYAETGGDPLKIVMKWARKASGGEEKGSHAFMVSAASFKLTISHLRDWGEGVGWKAVQAACPMPVPISREEARKAERTELAGRVLIRTVDDRGDEPLGFYILPDVPAALPRVPKRPDNPYYYILYELNGVPPAQQFAHAERITLGDIGILLKQWNDPASGLADASLSDFMAILLQAVQIRKRRDKKTPKPDPASAVLLESPAFKALEAIDAERAQRTRDYLAQ